MRLIDADALIHELNNSHYPGAPYVDAGISIAIGKIWDAPTIDPDRIGKGTCDNCLYSSHFKNGLILCRRKKDSERVEPNHFCKYWKMDAKDAKMEVENE